MYSRSSSKHKLYAPLERTQESFPLPLQKLGSYMFRPALQGKVVTTAFKE